MKQFLKEWGGWISTFVTIVIFVAMNLADEKIEDAQIESLTKSVDELLIFMKNQYYINGVTSGKLGD